MKYIEKILDMGGVFYLKYESEGKPQELRVKSSNVQGLYSTINTVLEIYREKNKPITELVRPSEQEDFSFENTYLSDSFFDKMERDVEAEATAANTEEDENVTTLPSKEPVEENLKPKTNKAKPRPSVGWVTARRPVEEKPPALFAKDISPRQGEPQQDTLTSITTAEKSVPECKVLDQQAQQLLLVKTHQKSNEHESLANEMDIDISNIGDTFMAVNNLATPNTSHQTEEVGSDSVPNNNQDANNTTDNSQEAKNRLVVIKKVIASNNNNNNTTPSSAVPSMQQTLPGSVVMKASTKTSSRRSSVDYENLYSTFNNDLLMSVGSKTKDASEVVEKLSRPSKSSLDAQAVLQSIEDFLETKPIIELTPSELVVPPRGTTKKQTEKRPDSKMYSSLDDLLRETELILEQSMEK